MKNKAYPPYPAREHPHLRALAEQRALGQPDSIVFCYTEGGRKVEITSLQFWEDIQALGSAFLDAGLCRSPIALIGSNSYEWLLTYFAAACSGNVIVPLDKDLPFEDIPALLEQSRAAALVYADDCRGLAPQLQAAPQPPLLFNIKVELPALLQRGRALLAGGASAFRAQLIQPGDIAALLFTSGTTGAPKGVPLSHRNILSNTAASLEHVRGEGLNLLLLPLHHAYTMAVPILGRIQDGQTIAINRSLRHVQQDLETWRPQCMALVPLLAEVFYQKIWSKAQQEGKARALRRSIRLSDCLLALGIDLRPRLFRQVLGAFGGKLDLLLCGGAPLDPQYERFFRSIGIALLNGYGITECGPIVSVNRNRHHRPGSVGTPLSCCEVKIDRPDPQGIGEIWVKGSNVFSGYLGDPAATAEAFEGPWFKTGDLGRRDRDGFLYITGRRKNLIILSNGKNVSPEELEAALLRISYVLEALVFPRDGVITAALYLDTAQHPGCAARLEEDLLQLNKGLPPYKTIRSVVLRDSPFPKTTSQKIIRRKEATPHA